MVGWYHSHPVFARTRVCGTSRTSRTISGCSGTTRPKAGERRSSAPSSGRTLLATRIFRPTCGGSTWRHVASASEDASEPTNGGPFELRCDRDESASMDAAGSASRGERLGGCLRGRQLLRGGTGARSEPGAVAERATDDGDTAGDAGKRRAAGEGISNESADRVDMLGTGATERPGWRSWREASSPGCRARGRMSYATGTSAASSSTFVRRGTSRRTRRERRDD